MAGSYSVMAEKAFEFWQEKEKEALDSSRQRSPFRPVSNSKSVDSDNKTFPRGNSSAIVTRSELDSSELFRPLGTHRRDQRPHSIAVVPPNRSSTPAKPTTSFLPQQPLPPVVDEDTNSPSITQSSQSAPSTLETRKSSWSWKKPTKPRHHSLASRSFVSYLDGPIENQVRSHLPLKVAMVINFITDINGRVRRGTWFCKPHLIIIIYCIILSFSI